MAVASRQSESASVKRRKIDEIPEARPHIVQLPDVIFEGIIKYLSRPSVGFLAVALTAPSSRWREVLWEKNAPILSWVRVDPKGRRRPSAATNAVMASTRRADVKYWSVIDFEVIGSSLASRLSDDDLAALLACIDCKSRLKRLKLTGLVNITGSGLEPLRHSIQIEQLDFSLLNEHESPDNERKSLLSKKTLVRFLRGIISTNGNLLKHLQFPKSWLTDYCFDVDELIEEYNSLMTGRKVKIYGPCTSLGHAGDPLAWDDGEFDWFDSISESAELWQNLTCYSCLRNFCYQCDTDVCRTCVKNYCSECWEKIPGTGASCENIDCASGLCNACRVYRACSGCGRVFCMSCVDYCDYCDDVRCHACAESLQYYYCEGDSCYCCNCVACVHRTCVCPCNECGKKYCFKCRLKNHQNNLAQDGGESCPGCADIILPQLMRQNDGFKNGVNMLIRNHAQP